MDRKPFDQMTDAEQDARVDEWIREAKARDVRVGLPPETRHEGYYHVSPDA
ncbi:hypothetical protein [Pandoraea apista]|uniref:hypothetical protein n=1 Tax=Pandoraea apista TaxID=93218 RepID=UPI001557B238|nr:hypothetical protein [Pandoraea apista]